MNAKKILRTLTAYAIGFGISYFCADYVRLIIVFFLVLHNGLPSTPDGARELANQTWWWAFIGVGVLASGAALTGLQIGNVLDHASDRADKEG